MKWCWGLASLIACSSPAHPPVAPPAGPAASQAPAPPAVAAANAAEPPRHAGPPPARLEPFTETLHGVEVRDPYRWMERGGADLEAFLDAQAAYAHRTLAAIPGRDQLRDELNAANRGITRISVVGVTASLDQPRVFLLKRAPEDSTPQLYVRDGWDGADRLLFDPRTRDAEGVHHAIDYARPAPDGKHVAYGVSASGSEDSVVEILDVDRGATLPEKIDRAQYAGIAWRDARSFYYWRRRAPAPGDTRADWFKNSASYLHVLGDDPERARPVFGPAMRELGIGVEDFSVIRPSPRSRWATAAATPGTSADLQYFVAPVASATSGRATWRRITGPKDHVHGLIAHADTLYVLSYADAPHYRVLALDAAKGTLASARVFVPEGDAVIRSMVAAGDALYLQRFDGAQTLIDRVSYDGKRRSEIKLPFAGSASLLADPARPGVLITVEGWTRPPSDFWYDPAHGLRELGLREPWPIDYSNLTSEIVEVTSADGTKVPMSIVRRSDTPLDGRAAGMVTGYQAYGSTDEPAFSPIPLSWVARGGVRAVCHGRGSGNLGKQWHLGGTKHNKERGIEDFIACAEYLVAHRYTSTSRLTVTGTSAGGVLAGGAVTRRPDLYAAALLRVPLANLMRFETTEGGPANVPEFGTVTDPEDFKAMLASDPYHRLVDGTKYPAMVITGGKHDVRVPVWIPAKFAARAQAATASDRPILLRVESDAGHGHGSTQAQIEEEWADLFAFALWQSGIPIAR